MHGWEELCVVVAVVVVPSARFGKVDSELFWGGLGIFSLAAIR